MEQNTRPSYDYAKHQSRNLEAPNPVTPEDYVNRIMENTQYLTENEYHTEFLVHHQEFIKEPQNTDYITSLLSPVLRQAGRNTNTDAFKKIWEKIQERKEKTDSTLADVGRNIEASYKLAQHKLREQPDLPQDLRTGYQKAYQKALNFSIQEKVKDAKNYDDLITAVNQYIDLSASIKKVEDKVLAKLNQTEDDLKKEVLDHKNTKYITFEQKLQLSDDPNIVTIKEMRNDIYERKQWMDTTLATINDRVQTPKQWLQKTFKKRSDIPKELQKECVDAYQQASKREKKFQSLIEQVEYYDDLKQYIDQSKDLLNAIDKLEQAQLKVLLHIDKKWALDVKQKEDTISELINIRISKKLEQLQKIVDEEQRKDDHAFNRDFINSSKMAFEDLLPRSEKELRLAYTIEKRERDEFDQLTPRNASLKTLDQVIREFQQLDIDLDKLLKQKS